MAAKKTKKTTAKKATAKKAPAKKAVAKKAEPKKAPAKKAPAKKAPAKKAVAKAPAKKAAAKKPVANGVPTYEEIAQRAYTIYERRGHSSGSEVNDWLQAEQELRKERGLPVE